MKSRAGITIMEVVVMVVVLGVVTAITFPQFRTMLYQSREGRTKASLGDMRGALAIFYSDNSGLYPEDTGSPDTRLKKSLVPTYLKEIPHVELPHLHPKSLNTVQDRFTNDGDWVYQMFNGFIAVNSNLPDTKGMAISNW